METSNYNENKMGVMPINKLLITMSLPMIISMLVQALYNVVDSIFVSQISENALTAVSLAFPLQNFMIAVGSEYLNGKNIVEDTINKGRAFNEDIAQKTSSFMSENHAKINKAGVSNALASAEFAAAFSVAKNAMSVIRDEKDGEDAAKEVLKDTVSAGVLGYATGAISEAAKVKGLKENRTALLVNGTIQITKQIYSYVNSDIDEKQLVQNIAETTAYLTAAYAGRIVGEAVGMAAGGPIGAAVGQYVGEMITTAVCSTIIDTVHRE